jgi:hypothetical protein
VCFDLDFDHERRGFSLKNSGFLTLSILPIRCEPWFMSHCRKVESNSLLYAISSVFYAYTFQYMGWLVNFATEPVVERGQDHPVILNDYRDLPAGKARALSFRSSNNVFASCKSLVSKPSVNQL